jgi:molybdopterin-guanine dinucleotide biosynthesis protein A
LGGTPKANLLVAGRSLLVRTRQLLPAAGRIVVVGQVDDVDALGSNVVVTQERPPGGGPVAGLDAGLALVDAPVVVVLAVDMPLLTRSTIDQLIGECTTKEAAMLVDESGRRQPLAAVYRTSALREALDRLGPPAGRAMRDVVAGLAVTEISTHPDETLDCNTWKDVARARRILEDS